MNRALILSSAALLTTLAACGESKNVANEAETSAGDAAIETATAVDPAPAPVSTPGTGATAGYAAAVAQADLYEIEASKLALERSNSPEIKQFAQMMIDGHSQTTTELKSALAAAGLAVTPALDPRHQTMLAALRDKTALAFDTAYLDQQSVIHGEALALHERYAGNGDNPVVKAFAAKTAPVVQAHLDTARKLDRSGADEPAANPPQ